MRIADWSRWVGAIAIAVLALTTSVAGAATPAERQVRAAVTSYVAAVRAHDAPRMCALLAPGTFLSRRRCAAILREEPVTPLRVRVGAVAASGDHGRAAVAYGTVSEQLGAGYYRTRVLVHRTRGRWLVSASGELPGTEFRTPPRSAVAGDPAPAATRPALARLVDDLQLGLSGEPLLACELLARRNATPSDLGRCRMTFGLRSRAVPTLARWGVLRHAVLSDGGRRARLTATVVTKEILRSSPRRHTFTLRTVARTETLFARRDGAGAGRWRLARPPASYYAAIGVPAPSDVDRPTTAATWPMPDAAQPSLSERPVPAPCRTPPLLWRSRACSSIGALAGATLGAGALVAWSDTVATTTLPTAAGAASGSRAALAAVPEGDRAVVPGGLLPVGTGALLVETADDAASTWSATATPLGADGRPAGAPQVVAGPFENSDDSESVEGVATAPGSATAAAIVGETRIERLTATGTRAARDLTLPERTDGGPDRFALLPDSTLVEVTTGFDGILVQRLDADGRATGPAQAIRGTDPGLEPTNDDPGIAVDAAGRVLVLWRETGVGRRELLRAWVYDPAVPTANAPVTVGWVGGPPRAERDRSDGGERTVATAAALPGGGWAIAYGEDPGLPAPARIWAGRLSAGGAVATPPRVVGSGYSLTPEDPRAVVLAGDTVAWIAPPQIAGLPQVRSAPLP